MSVKNFDPNKEYGEDDDEQESFGYGGQPSSVPKDPYDSGAGNPGDMSDPVFRLLNWQPWTCFWCGHTEAAHQQGNYKGCAYCQCKRTLK